MNMDQRAKIKDHFRENKNVYIAAGVGVLVGAAGCVFLKDSSTLVSIRETLNFKWKSPTTNVVQLIIPPLGDAGNVVQCVETGTIYASQGQAARELGVRATDVSKHMHGVQEHVAGLHLKLLGKAGEPLAG